MTETRPQPKSETLSQEHAYFGLAIVLVGMPGSGKTTIGRELAKNLNLPFYDVDEEIEKKTDQSVTEIFRTQGEAVFRSLERQMLENLLDATSDSVIATGGGSFSTPENRALFKDRALTLWLDVGLELLWKRIRYKSTRPLLAHSDPKYALEMLFKKRRPDYKKAQIHICSKDSATCSEIVKDITKTLIAYEKTGVAHAKRPSHASESSL